MNFNPKAPPVYKPNPHKISPPAVYQPSHVTSVVTQAKRTGSLQVETRPAPPVYRPGLSASLPKPSLGRSIQPKPNFTRDTRRVAQPLPIQRARAAAVAARPPGVINLQYDEALHRDALLAANVQAVSTFFHANEAEILPKGKQSRVWSPYIEFNLATKYHLGARAIFDVEEKKIFLAGHYDDGGDYELLTGVPAEVTASMTGKALAQLKNLCVGTGLERLADWTTVQNMDLLLRSMKGNFQLHGNPLGKV